MILWVVAPHERICRVLFLALAARNTKTTKEDRVLVDHAGQSWALSIAYFVRYVRDITSLRSGLQISQHFVIYFKGEKLRIPVTLS